MPVYEFLCDSCGPFERRRSIGESDAPMLCPACDETASRVYSMPGFTVLSRGQKELRRREGQSGEPRLGVKSRPEETPAAAQKLQRGGGRPWEISH